MKELKLQVISVAHQKGGVGKTTTLVNLAVELSKVFDKVTVIDLDPQKQTIKFNQNRPEEKRFIIKQIKDDKELIDHIRNDTGLTLIDLGGYDSKLGRTVLYLSDLVITPLSDSDFELDGLIEFKKIMDQILEKQNNILVKLLINRTHPNDKKTHRTIKEKIQNIKNFDIYETTIPANVKYRDMITTGKSIIEKSSGTPAIIFQKFLDEVINDIKGNTNGKR